MLEIQHKRPDCIGCGLCVEQAPPYWEMSKDGLATLLSIKQRKKDFHYAEAFKEDLDDLKKAAIGCPVQIIKIHAR